ncbi:hypothetical protein N9924_00255 [bacterium]|nr:hypothetical protein [bacterium]
MVDKIVIKGEKYIPFNNYCEVFNKDPRTVRGSIADEKVVTKKFNGKTYIKI